MDAGTSVLETPVNHFVGSLASDDSWSETSEGWFYKVFCRNVPFSGSSRARYGISRQSKGAAFTVATSLAIRADPWKHPFTETPNSTWINVECFGFLLNKVSIFELPIWLTRHCWIICVDVAFVYWSKNKVLTTFILPSPLELLAVRIRWMEFRAALVWRWSTASALPLGK